MAKRQKIDPAPAHFQDLCISYWFDWPIPIKKNDQSIFKGRGGKPFIHPGTKYDDWVGKNKKIIGVDIDLLNQMTKCGWPYIEWPVFVEFHFLLPDWRTRDLSNLQEAPQDALTFAGCWKDDKLIGESWSKKWLAPEKDGVKKSGLWMRIFPIPELLQELPAVFSLSRMTEINTRFASISTTTVETARQLQSPTKTEPSSDSKATLDGSMREY